jgi:hypothetical protein
MHSANGAAAGRFLNFRARLRLLASVAFKVMDQPPGHLHRGALQSGRNLAEDLFILRAIGKCCAPAAVSPEPCDLAAHRNVPAIARVGAGHGGQ